VLVVYPTATDHNLSVFFISQPYGLLLKSEAVLHVVNYNKLASIPSPLLMFLRDMTALLGNTLSGYTPDTPTMMI